MVAIMSKREEPIMAGRKSGSRYTPPNRAERRRRELGLKLSTVLLAVLLAVFSTGAAADHIPPAE